MHRQRSPSTVRLAALVALLAVGAVVVPAAATDRVVVVRQGDTLSEIALRHGVTVAQLMALNALTDPNRIYPGERLRLVVDPSAQARPAPVATPIVHVVRYGEHLTGIARRYGTTIAAIVQANGLSDASYLRVGQRLVIPAAGSPASAPTAAGVGPTLPIVHVVTSGETLTSISHRYGTSIAAIVQANGLSDASYLRVGQRLTIPATSAPVVPGASMPAGMASLVRSRGPIGQIVAAEANAEGVPVAFALAVAWQESGWQAGAVSSAGAVGVMQLTKPTAEWVASSMLHEPIKLTDPRSNVHAGVILLKHYLARYQGDKALVLAAYYQGQTAVDQHGIYRMTRPYIASVFTLERYFTP